MASLFKNIKQAGFTLIEVLLYISFFVLIVGALLGVAYQTIGATQQINKKILVQQESDFVLRKIDWALSGASAVSTGPKPSDMAVTRFFAPNSIVFSQNGNFIDINSGTGTVDLNSQNVLVSNVVFTETQVSPNPPEIQTNFTLSAASDPSSGQNFELTKFLRQ